MKNHETVQEEIRKTLDFLDKMPKLDSNPFMFTRIQARLADATRTRPSGENSRASAVLRSALLVLLVVLNVVTIIETTKSTGSKTINRQQALSNMIDDYSLTDSSTSPSE